MTVMRTFQPHDLDSVVRLSNRTLRERYDPGIYIAVFQNHPEYFLVAYDSGKFLGFALALPDTESPDLRILMLSVHETYRRQSIGSGLLRELVSRALSSGIKRIVLEVNVENHEAISFYKRLGFSIDQMLSGYYATGHDAYRMSKAIA